MGKTRQANSKSCFVCGVENPHGLQLKFDEVSPGEVTADIIVPDHYQGYPGVVHGGIVASMLDEVTARTHMQGDPPRFLFTARLDVRYRKNVPTGQPLHLVGTALKTRDRMATAKGAIYGPDGSLLAEAEALLVNVPDAVLTNVDLETLGWKVYPEE